MTFLLSWAPPTTVFSASVLPPQCNTFNLPIINPLFYSFPVESRMRFKAATVLVLRRPRLPMLSPRNHHLTKMFRLFLTKTPPIPPKTLPTSNAGSIITSRKTICLPLSLPPPIFTKSGRNAYFMDSFPMSLRNGISAKVRVLAAGPMNPFILKMFPPIS